MHDFMQSWPIYLFAFLGEGARPALPELITLAISHEKFTVRSTAQDVLENLPNFKKEILSKV